MQPKYFGDKRDLIKWSVLFHLAESKKIKKIYQIVYYREAPWPKIDMDGDKFEIPKQVIACFRNIHSIKPISTAGIKIIIFSESFNNESRQLYQKKILEIIKREKSPAVIFLDPDTGLEPLSKKFKAEHVTESELKEIWNVMLRGSHLVLYQHKTTKARKEWIPEKKSQLAKCIDVRLDSIGIGRCDKLANDVVFFIVQK